MKIQIAEQLLPLYNEDYGTYIIRGGRSSSKSWGGMDYVLSEAISQKLFIQLSRMSGSSIDASSKKLFNDRLINHNIENLFTVKDTKAICKCNNTNIIFKGLMGSSKVETRNRMRSSEGIDILVIDEAQSLTGSMIEDIDPTIRGKRADGKKRRRIYIINPYDNPDPVFAFYKNDPDCKIIELNIMDNPFAPEDQILKSNAMKKHDPLLWDHVYNGQPINIGERSVINSHDYTQAVQRAWDGNDNEVIGIDVARMGSDATVMARRKGNALVEIKSMRKQTLDVTFEAIKQFVKKKHILIRIDATGLSGLGDFLRRDGWNVKDINFASKASDPKYGTGAGSIINEMWLTFAENIEKYAIIEDDELRYQLTTRQYTYDRYQIKTIETKDQYKKHGSKSPDKADAVILAFYDVRNKRINFKR